jgi:uncharacterized membrane protein
MPGSRLFRSCFLLPVITYCETTFAILHDCGSVCTCVLAKGQAAGSSGDFSGGLASRRAYVGSVVLTDYAVGLVLLVTLAFIGKEPVPAPADLMWGGLAGVAGVIGLLSFYAALARGKMGIAAPVSAVLTAALPVLFSAFTAGLPMPLQLAGFALAGLAIALISCQQRTTEPSIPVISA